MSTLDVYKVGEGGNGDVWEGVGDLRGGDGVIFRGWGDI